ncbi:MAG: methyltransferase domain-containing protein [Nitrospirae bacterium]|nr:methyltransferase domain-containing protein [Nitrospirota bacterium]
MSQLNINKPVSAKDILDHFKDWNLDEESKGYVKFHCKRYEFLIKETIKWIDKIRITPPERTLKILDIGKAYQTEIIRNVLPETIVNTLGFEDSRFKARGRDRHFLFNLNDAQYPEKWPKTEKHDLIIMAEVIEHLYTSPLLVLKCVAGFLRNGGYLIMQTPNACSFNKRVEMLMGKNPFEQIRLSNTNPGHFREYTIEELLDIGIQSGFMPVEYSISNYFNCHGKEKFINKLTSTLSSRLRDGITICFEKVETPELPELPEVIVPLNDNAIFSSGWYDIEKDNNGVFRWGNSNCLIQLPELKRDLQLKIFSSFPDIIERHVSVIFVNESTKEILGKVELQSKNEHPVILKTSHLAKLDLSISVNTTWSPNLYDSKSDDSRILGIGIRYLKFL